MFPDGLRPTLHIAHRGGAGLAPENTMAAFEQAVARWHTDMLELDVRPTADGHLVVFHDATLERCTDGQGPVEARTLDDLRRLDAGFRFSPDGGHTFPYRGQGVRIPTFDEVLDRFANLRLNVELKAGPLSRDAVPLLARLARPHLDRLCLGSEDDDLAARLHAALPEATHFFPAGALTALVMALKSGAEPPPEPRFTVLDMPFTWQGMRLVDPPLLAACTARGLWVNAWTVDAPEEMRYLVGVGVGGIMTDRPDLLRQVLDTRER